MKRNTKADSFLAQSSLIFLPLLLKPCVHNCTGNKRNVERRKAETRPRRRSAKLNEMKVPAQRRRRRDKHPDICHLPSTCHHFQEGPVSAAVSVSIGISFPPFFSPRVIYPRAGVSDYAHNKWQVEIIGHKYWNGVGCNDSFFLYFLCDWIGGGGINTLLLHLCVDFHYKSQRMVIATDWFLQNFGSECEAAVKASQGKMHLMWRPAVSWPGAGVRQTGHLLALGACCISLTQLCNAAIRTRKEIDLKFVRCTSCRWLFPKATYT